jgi:helicase
MKIKDLKNYGIPSYALDIWKEDYSSCLLPLQEEAVRNYGILSCGGNEEGRMQCAPTEGNDKRGNGNDRNNNNLLVIAPPSSGKSFLGEMAVMAHIIHRKKCIYLSPFRFYAEEKYSHFKDLYGSYAKENPREDSDIDLIVISDDFKDMNLRERLEILGIASRVFEPIEALGYTSKEIKQKKETFLEAII